MALNEVVRKALENEIFNQSLTPSGSNEAFLAFMIQTVNDHSCSKDIKKPLSNFDIIKTFLIQ